MLQIQNFSTQIILVNNAMILEEDDQTTFTARLQLQQLYQSLTLLHQCIHLNVYVNLIVDFLDMTLLSPMCMMLLFFHGRTQSQACTTQISSKGQITNINVPWDTKVYSVRWRDFVAVWKKFGNDNHFCNIFNN